MEAAVEVHIRPVEARVQTEELVVLAEEEQHHRVKQMQQQVHQTQEVEVEVLVLIRVHLQSITEVAVVQVLLSSRILNISLYSQDGVYESERLWCVHSHSQDGWFLYNSVD